MAGYTFFQPDPRLGEVVEAIWDTDVPQPGAVGSLVLPLVSPILCFHFRVPPQLCFQREPAGADSEWIVSTRYRVTGASGHAVRLRPGGPIGGVMVRLRPEATPRLLGSAMRELYETAFSLDDVFSPTEVALLDEVLSAAPHAAARVAAVQAFLLRRLRDYATDPLVCLAARRLQRDPVMPIRDLAASFAVSERHLSRRFQAMIGTAPKRFARIARLAKAVAVAREGRAGWADIAVTCGFNDQAHMVHDFTAMTGCSPQALFRTTSLGGGRGYSAIPGESEFYNTFVALADNAWQIAAAASKD